MAVRNFLFFSLCFTSMSCVLSLYEDQAGKFDWRAELIGKVAKVVFDSSSSSDKNSQMKRLYAITEQNVLAGLNWFTGEIIWRHVFEQGESGRLNELLLSHSGDIVTLSGGGQNLMSWERHRGTLRWSAVIANEYCQTAKMVEYKSGYTVVLSPCSGTLSAFDRSGVQTWTLPLVKQPGGGNIRWRNVVAGGSGSEIVVLGEDIQSSFVTIFLVSPSGNVVKSISKNIKYIEERVVVLSNPNRLLWFDANSGLVNSLELSATDSPDQIVQTALPDVAAGADIRLARHGCGHFALTDGSHVWIPVIQSSSATSNAGFKFEKVDGVSVSFSGAADSTVFAAVVTLSVRGGFSVRFYDTKTGKVEWDLVVPSTDALSLPETIYPFVQAKSDRAANAVGVIVVGGDHALALVNHPGKIAWSRQEALAEILSVEMLDLPLSEAQADIEEEFSTNGTVLSMFGRRITSQMIQLQRVFLNSVSDVLGLAGLLGESSESLAALASSSGGRNDKAGGKTQRLERDYFNLHKVIVVTTAAGKIFGLDNTRGAVVWQKHLRDISPLAKLSKSVMPLYVLRTTAHYPHPARVAVVARSKTNGNGVLISFNPITGADFQMLNLRSGVKQSFILPVTDKDELQGVGVVTDDLIAYVYPSSVSGDFSTFTQQKPFIVFLADGAGQLSGYRIGDGIPKQDDQNEQHFSAFGLEPAWKLGLPLDGHGKLIGATTKRVTEQVHSQGRVLGDRSVLYKYVNPNLVAAIAESNDSAGKTQMHIYLLDAVTGDIIFNAVHRRVTGPYHLVHCENWIVYAFWNEKARRNEVAVLELYEGKEQADPEKFSSFNPPPPPIVMRQAYVFPQGITALAVTDTEKGITTRHLLIAMPFGGILELSKMFLDPRRVLNPTMEQREEGLYPYIPDLPIVTEQIINYNQTVHNIRGIHTAPSGLESTSLILAYGLDLYFTRVTPSGTFDILKDDFDHWLIGCVLLGLFVGSAVTKKLAKHRDVKSAWR